VSLPTSPGLSAQSASPRFALSRRLRPTLPWLEGASRQRLQPAEKILVAEQTADALGRVSIECTVTVTQRITAASAPSDPPSSSARSPDASAPTGAPASMPPPHPSSLPEGSTENPPSKPSAKSSYDTPLKPPNEKQVSSYARTLAVELERGRRSEADRLTTPPAN
jgi:hypothetical protein